MDERERMEAQTWEGARTVVKTRGKRRGACTIARGSREEEGKEMEDLTGGFSRLLVLIIQHAATM